MKGFDNTSLTRIELDRSTSDGVKVGRPVVVVVTQHRDGVLHPHRPGPGNLVQEDRDVLRVLLIAALE